MNHPLEAYRWLLDTFHRYVHNQLTWLDVREALSEADRLHTLYRDLPPDDSIHRFAVAVRATDRGRLSACSDDYLWRKLRGHSDPITIAAISLLLWERRDGQ